MAATNGSYVRERLSFATKAFYGAGDIGVSLCIATVSFFLLFFGADVAKVSPALVGTALFVGKLWDAVTDPIMGWLTDRTRSRFGRRKVYLYFTAIPLGISFALLWWIPEGLSGVLTTVWIIATFLFYFTMFTIVSIAYYAMTPELTRDYDERTSIATFRMVGSTIGYLAGAGFPSFIASLFITQKIGWMVMGASFGAFIAIMVLLTAFGVKMKEGAEFTPSAMPPFQSAITAFKNKPFVFLVIWRFLFSSSLALGMSFMAFFITYQMKMKPMIPIVMTVFFVTIGVSLFFWQKIAERWEKGLTVATGLSVSYIAMAALYLLGPGDKVMLFVLIFIAGFGQAASSVGFWSMVPDVVEHDELMTGERREGIYYGLKGLNEKIAGAFGLFVGGWVLELVGYVPGAEQTATALLGIRLFLGPIPAIIFVISIPLLIWFPITRESHRETLRKLEAMRKQKGR